MSPSLPLVLALCVWSVTADGDVAVLEAAGNATSGSEDVVRKLMTQHCSSQYSMTCLKLDLVRLVEKLGTSSSYQLLPGIALTQGNLSRASVLPPSLVTSLAEGNSTKQLDLLLAHRVNDYLNSLTLTVKVIDSSTVNSARKLGERILNGIVPDISTGRRRQQNQGAALWAAGTIAAVGVSALAAVSGKALMTSLLALMLAGAGAMRGNGGSNGSKCSPYIDAHGRNIELERDDALVLSRAQPVYRPPYGPPQ